MTRGAHVHGDRDPASESRRFFDDLWASGDPWSLETSELDQDRYARQLELLSDRRYESALEIGCGAGAFTTLLAPLCLRISALDVSNPAIDAARQRAVHDGVHFVARNIMEFEVEGSGPWDLVVLAETVYFLGWLYPMFDVGWLAHALHDASAPGGRLLLVNTFGDGDGIMSDWLVWTYRDLFVRVGYEVVFEETLDGVKDTMAMQILVTLLEKTST